MTVHSPRVWWVAIALLLWTQSADCRNFTHDDIRDAILALARTIQASENKLERHEYREKTLGEQLKRMLVGLEKKHRALEPLNGMITRLDERLSNVETILLQKEEREKKTQEELEGIKKSLQMLTSTVTQAIKPVAKDTEIDNNLTTSDDTIDRRLDTTDAKIDAVKMQIENLKNTLSEDTFRATCMDLSDDMNPLKMHISDANKLLSKYEQKLNEYNGTASKNHTDSVSLDEVSLADEAWHNNMTEVLVHQEKDLNQIKKLLLDAESMWKDLPRRADLHLATNQTLDAISNATENIKENDEKSVSKVTKKVDEMSDRLVATNADIQNSLTLGNTMSEQAFGDISRSYDTLRAEVEKLTKNEHVLLETADNVLSTRKSVQYGVHQILTEVGELIKLQSKNMNTTVHERFDSIEATIANNQTASVGNITAKIESEMLQVWRQIGVMHQQLTVNKGALDALTLQTQQYIKSSTKSMRGVKDEVDDISNKIVKLAIDMNFALGQLSVSTQEFGQMSITLGEALDNFKKSASTDKSKPTDSKPDGPGPHVIPSAEKTT